MILEISKASEVASYVKGLSGFLFSEAAAASDEGGGGGVCVGTVGAGLEVCSADADREPERGGAHRTDEVANVRGWAQRGCLRACDTRKEGLRIVQEVSSLLPSNTISDALESK
ncbi:hypothetical protein CSPAE12_06063 [Colletotrichum incanum]|nr:hypothetical protein CSPAE12_06063 [Colletotrichum incanum]